MQLLAIGYLSTELWHILLLLWKGENGILKKKIFTARETLTIVFLRSWPDQDCLCQGNMARGCLVETIFHLGRFIIFSMYTHHTGQSYSDVVEIIERLACHISPGVNSAGQIIENKCNWPMLSIFSVWNWQISNGICRFKFQTLFYLK